MERLAVVLAHLLSRAAVLLPARRRAWFDALLAEAAEPGSPSARVAWLAGGAHLLVREVIVNLVLRAGTFLAGGAGLTFLAWPGTEGDSATAVNRMYVVGILILLAGLPLLVSRHFGPALPTRGPRIARFVGYSLVLGLVAATAVRGSFASKLGAYFPVIAPVWALDVGFLLLLGGYVAGLLILTARRRPRVSHRLLPTAVAIGATTAVALYPVAPFGVDPEDLSRFGWFLAAMLAVPLATHVVTTRVAAADPRPQLLHPARQALLATTCAMATSAFLLSSFTAVTVALLPRHVPPPHVRAVNGACPTCTSTSTVIPLAQQAEYTLESNVGATDSALAAMFIVPFVGTLVGALRTHLLLTPPAARAKAV